MPILQALESAESLGGLGYKQIYLPTDAPKPGLKNIPLMLR